MRAIQALRLHSLRSEITVRLAFWLLAASLFLAPAAAAQYFDDAGSGVGGEGVSPTDPLPNLALPTLGGRQLWQDTSYHGGWRLQRHVWSGHARLLDPDGWRQAWGSPEAVRQVFEARRRDPAITMKSDRMVMLLHGWGRSHGMWGEMKSALEAAGYEVLTISYPSTRGSLAEHGAALRGLLADLRGIRQVSFVTHSLGGIVLRQFLADPAPLENGIELGRAVLVAAPNDGAALGEMLHGFAPYRWVGGPVADALLPGGLDALPAPRIPFITVAGTRRGDGGWNPLLEGPNDGVVREAEVKLAGAQAHHRVEEIHTFIVNHPKTIGLALDFLTNDEGRP